MPTPTTIDRNGLAQSLLATLLSGGGKGDPFQNEKNRFANKPGMQSPRQYGAGSPAAPARAPAAASGGPANAPLPQQRPAGGAAKAPKRAATGPNNVPIPQMRPMGGPGGGTVTGQAGSETPYQNIMPNVPLPGPGGPGGGTMTGQAGSETPYQNIMPNVPLPGPGGPGGGTMTGQAGSETPYQNIMPNVPLPGGPPGGPGGGIRTGQDWPSVAALPDAGGNPNAPNWWEHDPTQAATGYTYPPEGNQDPLNLLKPAPARRPMPSSAQPNGRSNMPSPGTVHAIMGHSPREIPRSPGGAAGQQPGQPPWWLGWLPGMGG